MAQSRKQEALELSDTLNVITSLIIKRKKAVGDSKKLALTTLLQSLARTESFDQLKTNIQSAIEDKRIQKTSFKLFRHSPAENTTLMMLQSISAALNNSENNAFKFQSQFVYNLIKLNLPGNWAKGVEDKADSESIMTAVNSFKENKLIKKENFLAQKSLLVNHPGLDDSTKELLKFQVIIYPDRFIHVKEINRPNL